MNRRKKLYIRLPWIGILILFLMIFCAVGNLVLKQNYPEAFIVETEEGKEQQNFVTEDGKYYYSIKEDKNVVIVSYKGEDVCLRIPGEIDGKKVTEVGEAAFSYCSELEEIYIPDTITTIRLAAFASCPNLTDLYFEGDIELVEEFAFVDFGGTIHAIEGTKIYDVAKEQGLSVLEIE